MKKIKLSRGLFSVVDDDDYDKYSSVCWYASCPGKNQGRYYAARENRTGDGRGKRGIVYLHRAIMGSPVGMLVDHKNHDTLDNRKENLRVCTHTQNNQNRCGAKRDSGTGIRGVRWDKLRKKWYASIIVNKVHKYLGRFDDLDECAKIVSSARLQYFGEFAGDG